MFRNMRGRVRVPQPKSWLQILLEQSHRIETLALARYPKLSAVARRPYSKSSSNSFASVSFTPRVQKDAIPNAFAPSQLI